MFFHQSLVLTRSETTVADFVRSQRPIAAVATMRVVVPVAARCENPNFLQGDWFSMERGDDVETLINDDTFVNKFFDGYCVERWDDNSTLDAGGNHDSKMLYHSRYLYHCTCTNR